MWPYPYLIRLPGQPEDVSFILLLECKIFIKDYNYTFKLRRYIILKSYIYLDSLICPVKIFFSRFLIIRNGKCKIQSCNWSLSVTVSMWRSDTFYSKELLQYMGEFAQFGLNRFKQGQKHFSQLQLSLDTDKMQVQL